MRVENIKREWRRPIFVHCRKHRCPVCGGELGAVKVSRIVHSSSEEAKDFDFSDMIGNVKFIWTEFLCRDCGRNYSIDEICKIEKKRKRRA